MTLFGAWDQVSSAGLLLALPIAVWELSVGVYMTVKGFKAPWSPRQPSPTSEPMMEISDVTKRYGSRSATRGPPRSQGPVRSSCGGSQKCGGGAGSAAPQLHLSPA